MGSPRGSSPVTFHACPHVTTWSSSFTANWQQGASSLCRFGFGLRGSPYWRLHSKPLLSKSSIHWGQAGNRQVSKWGHQKVCLLVTHYIHTIQLMTQNACIWCWFALAKHFINKYLCDNMNAFAYCVEWGGRRCLLPLARELRTSAACNFGKL